MLRYLIELNAERWFSLSPSEEHIVGKAEKEAQIILEDDSVSARHARLFCKDDVWYLEDLTSEEGTFLDKKAVTAGQLEPLEHGQRVSFGFRDFVFSSYEPVKRVAPEQLPSQDLDASWENLPPKARNAWLVQALEELFVLELDVQAYLERSSKVFRRLFRPSFSVLALEDALWVEGIEEDDAFAEMVLHEARFQTSPLAFQSAAREEDGYRVLYAPLLLNDLARGYLYVVADVDREPWEREEFLMFGGLCRLLSQGLTALDTLRRAREDREVLHLNLVGIAPEMQRLKVKLLQTARSDAPVLVFGEDGVGKSRIARAVHQASARKQAPLMVLNAANFPKELFELDICGSVSDPLAPSQERSGKAVLADGGSFLIEEIGEVPLGVQPTLLALVRSQEVIPQGASDGRPCDVRLLATSRLPLNELIRQERLIPELAALFEQSRLEVPPLRQRKEDVPQLFRAFLARLGEEEGLPTAVVSDEALSLLKSHRWTLNIRELRDVVARCFYELDPDHPIVDAALVERVLASLPEGDEPSISMIEREVMATEHRLIQEALMAANDDIHEAANSLGVSLVVMRRKMRQLGIG